MNNMSNKYWTAFYTKPRSEKKAAERLGEKGFTVYCPTQTVVRMWSDRKKKICEPVFTSYIFAFLDEEERQRVLRDPSIVSSVFWLSKPVVIPDNQILAIKEFLIEFNQEVSVGAVDTGDRVEVGSGPLKGESGVIVQRRRNRVLLQIESLGLELRAEILASKLNLVN